MGIEQDAGIKKPAFPGSRMQWCQVLPGTNAREQKKYRTCCPFESQLPDRSYSQAPIEANYKSASKSVILPRTFALTWI